MPTKLFCKILETTTTTIYSPSPHKGTKQVLPASQREPKKYIVCFAIITLQLLTCCPVAALAVLHMFCTANSLKPVQITRGNVGYGSCPQRRPPSPWNYPWGFGLNFESVFPFCNMTSDALEKLEKDISALPGCTDAHACPLQKKACHQAGNLELVRYKRTL